MVRMGGELVHHQRSLNPIPSSQAWACGPSSLCVCMNWNSSEPLRLIILFSFGLNNLFF